jgi:hypothetical protein
MPVGAGGSPAGTSPAGYGVIDTALFSATAPLPDTRTGLSQGGRYINASSGDYSFGADGRLLGMPNVNQLVLLAIKTQLGSSAQPGLGLDLSSAQNKTPDFANKLTSILQNALADLVTRKLVQITSIVVPPNPNPDSGIAVVNWLDLTTGLPEQTPF